MSPLEIGSVAIAGLLVLIYIGMPIGVGMLFVSFLGVAAIRGDVVSVRMLGAVANDSLREYLFAVVPLFVLMGLLVTVSKVGKDTFDVFQNFEVQGPGPKKTHPAGDTPIASFSNRAEV